MKPLLILAALTVGPAITPDALSQAKFEKASAELTDCVVREVRLRQYSGKPEAINVRIERALTHACLERVYIMIEAYEQYTGESGVTYFSGRYLDQLPGRVMKSLNVKARP